MGGRGGREVEPGPLPPFLASPPQAPSPTHPPTHPSPSPAGALSGILSYYSVTYGSGVQPLLAIMTGLMSALVWASRMDKYLVFIPSAVMHGFTMGVSFIIAANQLNFILGLPKLKRHPEFLANLYETLMNIGNASGFAIVFFLLAFTSLFMLSKRYGKIPWAVVLAIVGIIIGAAADATQSNMPIRTIRTQYGDLSLELIKVGGLPLTSKFEMWVDLFKGSISITAVAVLETLISARIADRMTKTLFDQPREVLSVALANLASGLTGGIPATAALARTALNIKSGATSRGSGIVNAFAIIILSTVLFSAFKFLPLPIVGAILVNTAYRMLEIHEIVLLFRTDFPMFIVAVVTAVICIIEDPTMGIVYGTFLAMIRLLLGMLHGHAALRVYKGTRCELFWVFDLKDRGAVKACRRRFTGEIDEEDRKALLKKQQEAHAHGGPSTSLAKAAEALFKAREAIKMSTEVPVQAVDDNDEAANAEHHYLDIPSAPVDERLPKVGIYSLSGFCTYIAAQSHLDRIRSLFIEPATALPGVDVLVFSLEQCYVVDPDAMDAIGDLIQVSLLDALVDGVCCLRVHPRPDLAHASPFFLFPPPPYLLLFVFCRSSAAATRPSSSSASPSRSARCSPRSPGSTLPCPSPTTAASFAISATSSTSRTRRPRQDTPPSPSRTFSRRASTRRP